MKLTIKEVEALTNSTHEPCNPKDLPFPEENKKRPIFSDDLWEEVQDMYEEWLILHK